MNMLPVHSHIRVVIGAFYACVCFTMYIVVCFYEVRSSGNKTFRGIKQTRFKLNYIVKACVL